MANGVRRDPCCRIGGGIHGAPTRYGSVVLFLNQAVGCQGSWFSADWTRRFVDDPVIPQVRRHFPQASVRRRVEAEGSRSCDSFFGEP